MSKIYPVNVSKISNLSYKASCTGEQTINIQVVVCKFIDKDWYAVNFTAVPLPHYEDVPLLLARVYTDEMHIQDLIESVLDDISKGTIALV